MSKTDDKEEPSSLRGEAREKYIHDHDCPKAWEFYKRYAVGSKLCPSCLLCGKQAFDPADWSIRHADLPDIYICKTCVDAARSNLSATLPTDVIAALRRVADPQDSGEPFEFWPVYWPAQDEQGGCVLCGNGSVAKPATKAEDHAKTCGFRAAYEVLSKAKTRAEAIEKWNAYALPSDIKEKQ